MIAVNGTPVDFTQFPDGTTSFRFDPDSEDWYNASTAIYWGYDGDHECILLWYLVNHVRSVVGHDTYIRLIMPYIPNARMDRVKNKDEVFTLKWFTTFINDMHLDEVIVFDPHSNVSAALIDNIRVIQPDKYIKKAISAISDNNLLLCYPDEGAAKRYSELMEAEYIFGIKHRDWRTGRIERLELTTPDKVVGRTVLIVDDICSRGGTFTHTAKALKESGANDIYLYVSHCENTIAKGTVLTDGLIRHVFTTDSIYRDEYEKITVLK